jgi:hypothetical protein
MWLLYDCSPNSVDFWFVVGLDPASIPYVNARGGATCFHHCVSGRLKYANSENLHDGR